MIVNSPYAMQYSALANFQLVTLDFANAQRLEKIAESLPDDDAPDFAEKFFALPGIRSNGKKLNTN